MGVTEMTDWRRHTEEWLSAEHRDDDAAADAAFFQVLRALPAQEAPIAFVEQTVARAWDARTFRRRAGVTLGIAACVVVAVGAAVVLSLVFSAAARGVLTAVAGFATSAAVTLVGAAAAAGQWWMAATRAAGSLANLVATPQTAVVLFVTESIGLAALFMLRRLLHTEPQVRRGGMMCFI